MAASGFTPIQLYRTSTASAVPVDTNLADGELAINTTDEKLYFKNAAGTVKLLASNAASTGTVSSVAATVPAFLSVSGSPITTSGTLAISLSGTPLPVANGGTGTATPALVQGSGVTISGSWPNQTISATGSGGTVTSVTASSPLASSGGTTPNISFTGTLPVANGGTGNTTAQAEMNRVAQATTSGQYLRGNGTNVVMSAIQAADVPTLNQNTTGTAANVTGTVAIANGGTGQTTQQAALNALSGAQTANRVLRSNGTNVSLSQVALATDVTGTLPVANGGTGAASLTANNVLLGNGTSALQVVAPGTTGNVLTSNGTTWTSAAPSAPLASAGGVGAYALMKKASGTAAFGASVAGSDLRYAGANSGGTMQADNSSSSSGTWRVMSGSSAGGDIANTGFGLFLRIA
jgi:hypothetical protein